MNVTLQETQQNILKFQNELLLITNDLQLDPTLKARKKYACKRKIKRWQEYLQRMNDTNTTSFKYRTWGGNNISQNAYKNGIQGGRPSIYTPEEKREKYLQKKREYYHRKKREKLEQIEQIEQIEKQNIQSS